MNFKRVITALVLFPLLILILLKANIFIISSLIFITAFLCFYEWKNLYEFSWSLWILGEALLIINLFIIFKFNISIFFVFYIFFLFSFFPYLFKYKKENFKKSFFPFFVGLIYIFIGLYPFWEILQDFKREYLVYFFSVVFANDTGAYLIGKLIGKTPFFSKISPKKTWEGFFGGMIFALLIAVFINHYWSLFLIKANILIAITLAIIGSVGDLLESAFKRAVNKKDSGGIIVGHGGILDRLDGVLFSSPLFLFFLKIII